jgi:hypothetical protein
MDSLATNITVKQMKTFEDVKEVILSDEFLGNNII